MKLKYIKRFNENISSKPTLKFPTDKAINYLEIVDLIKSNGLDPYNLGNSRDTSIGDFFFEKCSKPIVYPNDKEIDIRNGSDRELYENFIFGDSVFLVPIKYDDRSDTSNFITKKLNFIQKMKDMFPNKKGKELEDFESSLEKNVNYGPESYDWANEALGIIYKKYSNLYVDGYLRVWLPNNKDYDCDSWNGYDFPHKYRFGDLVYPNGVYFLSDIEKYIESKYGISDDILYEFIIKNEYIEGRYWENIWYISNDEKTGNLKRKGGKYGMDATENIEHILNILEKDFSDSISEDGFPIYIDYYKRIKE